MMPALFPLALGFAYACFGASLMSCLWRVIRGRSAFDRILALDALTGQATALLILQAIALPAGDWATPALVLALLSFVGTLAYARSLLGRGPFT